MLPLCVGNGEVECKLKKTFKEPINSAALLFVLVAKGALRPGTEEEIQDFLAQLLMHL